MNNSEAETCRTCSQICKQPDYVSVIFCPHFQREPKQIEIKLNKVKVKN